MQMSINFPMLTKQQESEVFDPSNPICPFYGYVGNESAVNIALTVTRRCLGKVWEMSRRPCYRDGRFRVIITGCRSVGKTLYAKKFHQLIGTDYSTGKVILPFVEIDGTTVRSVEQILCEIERECETAGIPIQYDDTNGKMEGWCPPVTVFIDEVHMLPKAVAESLLKPTEPNDGMMSVGGKVLDCRMINWVVATTDPGKLKPALKSRFVIKVPLEKHTVKQMGQIIKTSYPDWDAAVCERLAVMKPIPRESLSLARIVSEHAQATGESVSDSLDFVSGQFGLDESGLSKKALATMRLLADSPNGLSKKNICVALDNMEVEEFENDVMPYLMPGETHPAYVLIGSRHKITQEGIKELERRNASNI